MFEMFCVLQVMLARDCWHPDQQGKATRIYSLAPPLGPAIELIARDFIAELFFGRWVFWSTSIAAAYIQVSSILFRQET